MFWYGIAGVNRELCYVGRKKEKKGRGAAVDMVCATYAYAMQQLVLLGTVESVDLARDDALDQHLLGSLGAHVGVRELLRDEDARPLARGLVDLVDGELDGAVGDLEHLVGLAGQLGLALGAVGLHAGERLGHVVASGAATALGVKEETRAVRGHAEGARELSAGGDGLVAGLGHELLHGEHEGHTLATRKLHGGGGVVDAVLLGEGEAALVLKGAVDAGEGVGGTGHELGVHELLGDGALALRHLLLDLERLGLKAQVGDLELVLVVDGDLTLGRAGDRLLHALALSLHSARGLRAPGRDASAEDG